MSTSRCQVNDELLRGTSLIKTFGNTCSIPQTKVIPSGIEQNRISNFEKEIKLYVDLHNIEINA